jgi:hypothetical protein
MLLVGIVVVFSGLDICWCIDQLNITHVIWLQTIASGFYLEDIFREDRFLISLFFAGLARISPNFLLDGIVGGEFEVIVEIGPSKILNSNNDFAWLEVGFGRYITKVPFKRLELILKSLSFCVR